MDERAASNVKVWEGELINFLQGVTLDEGVQDGWRWTGARGGLLSVKDAYKVIEKGRRMDEELQPGTEIFEDIWKGCAPFKAKMTMWRLIWDRLPTREIFLRRTWWTIKAPYAAAVAGNWRRLDTYSLPARRWRTCGRGWRVGSGLSGCSLVILSGIANPSLILSREGSWRED